MNQSDKGEIIIYRSPDGPELRVTMRGETVWLSMDQLARLFGRDKSVISRHIKNVINSAELSRNSVVANFATTAADGKTYQVDYYNLDMIISVGYRVNSKRGSQFRIWATQRLRDYLLKGYAINEQALKSRHDSQLKELQQTVRLFQNVLEANRTAGYEKDLLKIITDYAETWALLNKYDRNDLDRPAAAARQAAVLPYEDLRRSIMVFKRRLMGRREAGELFGQEVGDRFRAILDGINQTFGGEVLYPSLEDRAAHLLYFCIKDHPFADGNKRIGSLTFMLYLVQNNYLYNKKTGERKINDKTLTALALLVAESRPEQKTLMVKLIASLIR
ncbi:MAG TPA: RhuM family protein [Patescibacteria group bacterium]|nr:RhuM family protein [Patescibacteria group bacterium]